VHLLKVSSAEAPNFAGFFRCAAQITGRAGERGVAWMPVVAPANSTTALSPTLCMPAAPMQNTIYMLLAYSCVHTGAARCAASGYVYFGIYNNTLKGFRLKKN